MEQQKTEVFLTSYSQSHVLQYRMQEAGLKHGDTVTANLSNIRLEPMGIGRTVMFFCPMNKIEISSIISHGDDAPLPSDATLKGVLADPKIAKSGLFNLNNVTLHSNGTLQVIANEDTYFEPIEAVVAGNEQVERRNTDFYETAFARLLWGR